nr:hypothetical protein [uncultured Pseudomonas sp.]
MLERVVFSAVCAFLLVGCDDGQEVKEIASQALQAEQAMSETALYLPGGAGVDFGRKAASTRTNTTSDGREIKIVAYNFTEAAGEVDAALAKVLQAEGYVRTTPPADNVVLHAVYKKNDYSYISARYLKQKADSHSEKTTLVLSWEIKS